jgi:hypothetical protein
MHTIYAKTFGRAVAVGILTLAACGLGAACGSSSDNTSSGSGTTSGTQTGQSCSAASQCYPGVADGGVIKGTVTCLTQVSGGYCTHTCQADSDCCAISGECSPGHPQVCAPFESTGQNYCFLSCESAAVGSIDATTYCHDYANAAFGCRSTGGGKANKQVCLP